MKRVWGDAQISVGVYPFKWSFRRPFWCFQAFYIALGPLRLTICLPSERITGAVRPIVEKLT